MSKEPIAKFHACEKSMILEPPFQGRHADPNCRDENILKKVGESRQWEGDPKGRFCVAKSFAIGSKLGLVTLLVFLPLLNVSMLEGKALAEQVIHNEECGCKKKKGSK